MAKEVLSVSQLNAYIQSRMDADPLLGNVAVRGEISNYKLYPSGHHYFTLKDEAGALKCVMFKGNAIRLRFRPENGMKIIAMGKVSVFPRDGAYQLYCTAMALDGIGDLHAAFEQLKTKLAAQGLFDPAHKKPIPQHPKTIGIVTSSAGAAVHDMLRILRKRYPLVRVLLLPVRVQGAEAPGEIAAAIRYANRHNLVDLLIVGRGGGSIEDLWAFNEEIVAYAIYESKIPIISAVGHEPDVTISDFVADLRAATPSNAAELAVPDKEALFQQLDGYYSALETALSRMVESGRRHLKMLSASPVLSAPTAYLEQRRRDLAAFSERLTMGYGRNLERKNALLRTAAGRLDAMSPLKVLSRGYAMVQDGEGTVLRSVSQAKPGKQLRVRLSDGEFSAKVLENKEEA